MSDEKWDVLVPGYINPLAFTEVEAPWILLHKEPVTDEQLRRYLCEPGLDHSLGAIVARFREISVEAEDRIFMAPDGILGKIIWPLRHSKASYALGNYLGAIALCGLVVEMATVLLFEAVAEHLGITSGRTKPHGNVRKYFEPGRFSFERLDQARRIDALKEMKLLTPEAKAWLSEVKAIRRRHLHLLSQGTDEANKDAVRAFLAAVKVVRYVLGLDIRDGKVALRPEILSWMEAKGHRPSAVFMSSAEWLKNGGPPFPVRPDS